MRRAAIIFGLSLGLLALRPAYAAPATLREAQTQLASPNTSVRADAVVWLSTQGAQGTNALANHLAREPDPTVLVVVLGVLGKSQSAQVVAQVTAQLAHEQPRVRGAALLALASLRAPGARNAALQALLHPMTGDPEWAERSTALLALAEVAVKDDFAAIENAYKTGGGATRWLARACFTEVAAKLAPDAPQRLTRMLLDKDTRVAVSAAAMLYDVAGTVALTAHLTHAAPRVRMAVIGGLRQRNVKVTAKRLALIAKFDKDRGVRWSAAQALWHFEDEAGDDLILEAVRAKPPALWMPAYDLLRQRLHVDHEQDAGAWRKALAAWRKSR